MLMLGSEVACAVIGKTLVGGTGGASGTAWRCCAASVYKMRANYLSYTF
jgi:hypothetical protein